MLLGCCAFGGGAYTVHVFAENASGPAQCRRFKAFQGRYKAAEYNDFYEFMLAISKADNAKAMLVK